MDSVPASMQQAAAEVYEEWLAGSGATMPEQDA